MLVKETMEGMGTGFQKRCELNNDKQKKGLGEDRKKKL